MKKFYIILIALLMVNGVMAQWGSSCLPEGITFSTQAQIDSFQVNYPACIGIEGNVTISNGSDITNLNGLNVLTSIEGGLEIIGNYILNSLTGLNNLTSVGGDLGINNNVALTSLTGLDNIDAGSISHLYIIDNNLLSGCALQSICDYLASPNASIEIYDNATGCNSVEEVEAACGVGLDESAVSGQWSAVNIYPNPESTTITIETPTTPDKNTFVIIYNINSQQLIRRQIREEITTLDVAGLPPEIYLVKMISDDGVTVG